MSKTLEYAEPDSGCTIDTGIVLTMPGGWLWRTVTFCPYCKVRRRFVVREELMHGTTAYCCGCGGEYSECGTDVDLGADLCDDEPYFYGDPEHSKARHREMWKNVTMTKEQVLYSERVIVEEDMKAYAEMREMQNED